jgi:hypothetical protein
MLERCAGFGISQRMLFLSRKKASFTLMPPPTSLPLSAVKVVLEGGVCGGELCVEIGLSFSGYLPWAVIIWVGFWSMMCLQDTSDAS